MAHGKGKAHGKGAFAVRPHKAHGKDLCTAMPLPCDFLCRVLAAVFAVHDVFAVCFFYLFAVHDSLPCVFLFFAVRSLFAVRFGWVRR